MGRIRKSLAPHVTLALASRHVTYHRHAISIRTNVPLRRSPPVSAFLGLSGPASFGHGSNTAASSGSGNVVLVPGHNGDLDVPADYVSGSPLSATDTWNRQTIASLGLTPGSYVYTWGSGATADSYTLNINAVPEPATIGGVGVVAALLSLRRRRRMQSPGTL